MENWLILVVKIQVIKLSLILIIIHELSTLKLTCKQLENIPICPRVINESELV